MLSSIVYLENNPDPSTFRRSDLPTFRQSFHLFPSRDEKPITTSPIESAFTNGDARNSFRRPFYENCRVSYPHSSQFGKFYSPFNVKLFLFTLFHTLLRSQKTQPLCFHAIPNSLPKNPAVGYTNPPTCKPSNASTLYCPRSCVCPSSADMLGFALQKSPGPAPRKSQRCARPFPSVSLRRPFGAERLSGRNEAMASTTKRRMRNT
jgi:hypothetical protein